MFWLFNEKSAQKQKSKNEEVVSNFLQRMSKRFAKQMEKSDEISKKVNSIRESQMSRENIRRMM